MERLKQLVVAVVGREEVGCVSGSRGGTLDDKVGEGDERDPMVSSHQGGTRLRGGKLKVITGRKKERKETRVTEMGGKITGVKEKGGMRQEGRRQE